MFNITWSEKKLWFIDVLWQPFTALNVNSIAFFARNVYSWFLKCICQFFRTINLNPVISGLFTDSFWRRAGIKLKSTDLKIDEYQDNTLFTHNLLVWRLEHFKKACYLLDEGSLLNLSTYIRDIEKIVLTNLNKQFILILQFITKELKTTVIHDAQSELYTIIFVVVYSSRFGRLLYGSWM